MTHSSFVASFFALARELEEEFKRRDSRMNEIDRRWGNMDEKVRELENRVKAQDVRIQGFELALAELVEGV